MYFDTAPSADGGVGIIGDNVGFKGFPAHPPLLPFFPRSRASQSPLLPKSHQPSAISLHVEQPPPPPQRHGAL